MRNTVLNYIDRFRHDRHQRLVHGSVLLILATVVSLTVYWQLRLSGITMTNETYCGYEEHTHTEECYEYTLICELEETEEHVHDETCYDEEGNLICGLEESERHTHSEECYETTLICELEEHVHTVDCLVNLEADVETAVDWEATLPELTGDLRTDIVNIAYSQIGYAESTANYTLAEDGITHLGYTRYGAWYGGLYYSSEYSDWDSMFVAFCLDYAGVAEELTYNSGAFAWSVELAELGYYQSADAYTPEVGDVVFIDTNLDGRADVTAIVVAIDETITVVQGDVSDTVALVEYPIDDSILGYANVTYTEETEDEEIALDESDEITAEEFEELDVSAEDEDEVLLTLEFVGTDYIITVSYGEDAALPEGTELVAYEYAQDSENFLARYEEAAELYGWDDSDETDPYHGFRLFNIGLYYDGAEIEPAAAVTVTVTYTGETDAASVSVTHFGNTATETLDATLTDGDDSQSVTFTADGFSDYGIMLTADAGTYKIEIKNSIDEDGKLIAVITDSDEEEVQGSAYTWYRSKEPYLTDSEGNLESAPATGTYNYLYSTSSSGIGATVNDDGSCTVGRYVFYYYYVEVTINGTKYECDPVYASVDGAASYVKITNSNNTLTATLYDNNEDKIDTGSNNNITYTYTWYKSRTYEAAEGTTESDAPYANTIANTNDYVAKSGSSASLTLTENDSFYFYYVIVTMKYTLTDDTTSLYAAYAKGYEDWAYAGLISSSDYTAVIVDNISSNGTFEAVLYDANGDVVDTSDGYTVTWYKSNDKYLTTSSNDSNIYSDQNVPSGITYAQVSDEDVLSGNTVNVAKDLGGLHYYYVVIENSNEEKYTSAVKYVQYSDQIENGGFENGVSTESFTSTNELKVVYWHTTNGEYTENHGTYRGYNSIEIGYYGGSTALGTYAIAYTKAGNAAQDFFVELNATEASTLYQSVITAPKTTYYWSVYHQNRSYSASSVSSTKEGQQQNDYYRQTTVGTGTDSMYVIIMSDADAELLLADVNENDESYDEQQEVIDAAAAAIAVNGNLKTDKYMESSESYGAIDGYYEGDYQLKNSNEKVHVTLWQVTTTKTVTRVTFYTDSTYKTYADVASLADTYYPASDGWAPITSTSNNVTTTYGYYQVTDWVKYTGSYTVPDGQYLTRFFFAAAYAQGGTASGNFIDGVSLTSAIDYTIEYWVWDYDKCEYVLQTEDTEKGSTTPYSTVYASKHDDYLKYYGFVGSVTSYQSGGENPKSFDSTKNTSLYVDAYNYVLSLYYGGPGVIVDKVISGVSTAALSALDTTVNFTVTDTTDSTNTATLNVSVKGAASGESSAKLKESIYTIVESDCSSLFDGKYVWVGVDVTGATDDNDDGVYEFTITNTDPLPTVTYTNNYLPVVTLKKVNSANTVTLSGVEFAMYKVDDTTEAKSYYKSYDSTNGITWFDTAVSLTTGTDGTITYSALPDGTYYLVETHAADGYNILTETLSFTISVGTITEVKESEYIEIDKSDTYGLTILVKNTPGVELPETGGISLPVAYAVGSLMILASAIGLVVRRKKI